MNKQKQKLTEAGNRSVDTRGEEWWKEDKNGKESQLYGD